MELSKLITPAKERLDLDSVGLSGDYVTLRGIPDRVQWDIQDALTANIDTELFKKYFADGITPEKIEIATAADPRTPELVRQVVRNHHDVKILKCVHGVMPTEHSVTNNGKSVTLDKKFWAELADSRPAVFEAIVKAVDDYQASLILTEEKKTSSNIPSEISSGA